VFLRYDLIGPFPNPRKIKSFEPFFSKFMHANYDVNPNLSQYMTEECTSLMLTQSTILDANAFTRLMTIIPGHST